MVTILRRSVVAVALTALALGATSSTWAQDPNSGSTPEAGATWKSKFGFGAALGFLWNVAKPDIVSDATVDALGYVRVNKRSNTSAGIMLEAHVFPWVWTKGGITSGGKNDGKTIRGGTTSGGVTWGNGFFVGIKPGSDEIVESAGLGWMVGWKTSATTGFNLGLGYASIRSAKTLGREFKDGQLAPVGPDNKPLPVRFQERDKGSVFVMMSVSWSPAQ